MKCKKSLLLLSVLFTASLVACNPSTPTSSSSAGTGTSSDSSTPVTSDSTGGTGDSSTSSNPDVEQGYVVRVTSPTGVTLTADKQRAEAGEKVTITVSNLASGFNLVAVTYNGNNATKVNDTTYTFVMPSQSVIVTARLSVEGDITIQGDFTAAFEDLGNGLYAARNVTAQGSGNFSVVVKGKDSSATTTLYQYDIDRTKCFGNLDIARGDYTGSISDGGTYDFYYDSNSSRPLYIQRTKVNTLPTSVDSLYNLFYGRVQSSAGNFAPNLSNVEYSNSEDNIKATYKLSADGKKSLTTVTETSGKSVGEIYKEYDETNQLFKWVDTTFSFEGQDGQSGKYKIATSNTLTGSEVDDQEWNSDSQFIHPMVAPFEVKNNGYDMYNVEFDFMDAYRVGMIVEDYVKSANIEVTSEETNDGFKAKIVSSKTYDSTGATDSGIKKVKEHTEYRVEFEFASNGAIKSINYLSKVYDDTKYDFASDKFISGTADENFENSGTIGKELKVTYTYDASKNTTGFDKVDGNDISTYFISEITSATLNNPEAEGEDNTNSVNCGDSLTESEYLSFTYAPSTALDKWQYDVVSFTKTSDVDAIRWNDSYNRFEAINEGTAKVKISNLSDQKAALEIEVKVVYNIFVRSFYIQRYAYENEYLDVDSSTDATIYSGGKFKFGLHASGDLPIGEVALPPDIKVTYKNDNHGLESYIDIVDRSITFDASKVSITSEVTVDFTISTEHTSLEHGTASSGSTNFSVTIKPGQGATIDALKGTWTNTSKAATINIVEEEITIDGVQRNQGTITVNGQTYKFAFTVDQITGSFSYSRIIDDESNPNDNYTLLLTYSTEDGLGVYLASSSWSGQDEVSTGYILGGETGDEDFPQYEYDYFTK